jgi:hypothetical protein
MPYQPEVASKAVLEAMLAEKLTIEQMTERLGIHRDSVRRALRRHKLVPVGHRPCTPEEIARVQQLGAEGMIAPFIAEDVGLNTHTVHRILGPRPEVAAEWGAVWGEILHDERVLEWHRRIAPGHVLSNRTKEAAP